MIASYINIVSTRKQDRSFRPNSLLIIDPDQPTYSFDAGRALKVDDWLKRAHAAQIHAVLFYLEKHKYLKY